MSQNGSKYGTIKAIHDHLKLVQVQETSYKIAGGLFTGTVLGHIYARGADNKQLV